MSKDAESARPPSRKTLIRPANDRLFLDLIRTNGQMSKAELTRASGLSAQSATVIVNRLVGEGFLKAGDAVKGKVGQPSTPYSLDPDGAYSIGVKVGRRSLEVASMSFDYQIIERIVRRYDFPHLTTIRNDILNCIAEIFASMTDAKRAKVVGIGIALPDDLSAWETTVGAPKGAMEDWKDADLAAELTAKFELPVSRLNDASAACLAEIALGNSENHSSFVYFYVGTFIGGGVSLAGQLYGGQHDRAGAMASLPTAAVSLGVAPQLLEGASLHYLEEAARDAGIAEECFYQSAPLDQSSMAIFENWVETAASQIAFAVVSAQAFLDPDAIIVDSSLTPELTSVLIAAIRKATQSKYDNRGLDIINIVSGSIGIAARAIGSGIVPFQAEFALDG